MHLNRTTANAKAAVRASVVPLLLLLVLSGCPKPWTLIVFNNTEQDLVLVLPDGDRDRPAATSTEILGRATVRSSDLHWVADASGNEIPTVIVKRSGTRVAFVGLSYAGLPDEYVRYSGQSIELRLQLEPDGSLYVIGPALPLPARPLPPQPEGFPLVGRPQ